MPTEKEFITHCMVCHAIEIKPRAILPGGCYDKTKLRENFAVSDGILSENCFNTLYPGYPDIAAKTSYKRCPTIYDPSPKK